MDTNGAWGQIVIAADNLQAVRLTVNVQKIPVREVAREGGYRRGCNRGTTALIFSQAWNVEPTTEGFPTLRRLDTEQYGAVRGQTLIRAEATMPDRIKQFIRCAVFLGHIRSLDRGKVQG